MQLTDPVLPWLAGLLAAGVFVSVVLGWPRWRKRWARQVGRGVSVLLINALVIGMSFLLLNNTYVFYSSWSDVFGTSPLQQATAHGGSAGEILQKVPGPTLARVTGKRDFTLPDPGKRMQSYEVNDVASSTRMNVLVYLPAGYRSRSSRRYPVIVGLHGFPAVPHSFAKINFLHTADRLTREHQLAPTIFVIPQINNPTNLDTECVNGPAGAPQTDTWLSSELPRWVVAHFHVQTGRLSWATLGYSFGGWCAAELTMRHPSIFSAALVFEGYFELDFGRTYRPITGAARRPYDLVTMAGNNPPPVAVWVFGSRQDGLSAPTTTGFVRRAKPPLVVSATIVPTGGHRSAVYSPYTAGALSWLARTIPGFHA